jgi:uncharacterized protein YciI
MSYFVTCIDKLNSLEKRIRTRDEHIDYLKKFKKNIITAGPLIDKTGTPYGSLLILNFENMEEVKLFLNNDPYAKKELFQEVTVKEFKKVF